MDTVTKVFGLLGPIIGLATANPWAALIMVVAGGIFAFILYKKFKEWKWAETHKVEQEQAAKDNATQIQDNQTQSVGDSKTQATGEKLKDEMIAQLQGKKP